MNQQDHTQPVDVTHWTAEQEFNPYPVGARDKSLLISPSKTEHKFLHSNYRYLYKHSSPRYPEQYWVEVLSFRFGQILNVNVPPAYVGFDADSETCGAVIEWFLKDTDIYGPGVPFSKIMLDTFKWNAFAWFKFYLLKLFFKLSKYKFLYVERYTPGGDFLQRAIANYDRKVGEQHNFETVLRICEVIKRGFEIKEDLLKYWVKIFIFDALIGNTDRHQDNWGIIWGIKGLERVSARMTPVFDNGTSMGHEILEKNFNRFDNISYLDRYILRGNHHMKYKSKDSHRLPHIDAINVLVKEYPESYELIENMLDFDLSAVRKILDDLCNFNVTIPLSDERAHFMYKLIERRKELLAEKLIYSK